MYTVVYKKKKQICINYVKCIIFILCEFLYNIFKLNYTINI